MPRQEKNEGGSSRGDTEKERRTGFRAIEKKMAERERELDREGRKKHRRFPAKRRERTQGAGGEEERETTFAPKRGGEKEKEAQKEKRLSRHDTKE